MKYNYYIKHVINDTYSMAQLPYASIYMHDDNVFVISRLLSQNKLRILKCQCVSIDEGKHYALIAKVENYVLGKPNQWLELAIGKDKDILKVWFDLKCSNMLV